MKVYTKRKIIIGGALAAAAPALLMTEPLQSRWLAAVLIVAAVVDWQLVRCPKCGGNMGLWDKDECARCHDKAERE